MADDEVKGGVTGVNNIICPQAPVGLGLHGHWVVNFHLVGVLASVIQLRNVPQILSSVHVREQLNIL